MRKLSWAALGLAAYLAFALTMLPAATAYRWLAPDALRLAGVEGTLWSGRAALGSVSRLSLHDIRWELRPLSLLLGRVRGELEVGLPDGFIRSQLSASLRRVRLTDVQASTSLPSLRELLPLGAAEGSARVSLELLELAQGWPVDASGELRVAQLAVTPLMPTRTPTLIALGDYRISFAETGGTGLRATLADSGGPLEVSGNLTLAPDRSYALEGYVRPRPGAPPELVQGLAFMTGEPDSAGRRPFSLTGSL